MKRIISRFNRLEMRIQTINRIKIRFLNNLGMIPKGEEIRQDVGKL